MKPHMTAARAKRAKREDAVHVVADRVPLIEKQPKHERDARVQLAHDTAVAACDAQWEELKSGPFQRKGMKISRLDANGNLDGFELSFGFELSQIII